MIIANEAGELVCPYDTDNLTSKMFSIYKAFNREHFPDTMPGTAVSMCKTVYDAFRQNAPKFVEDNINNVQVTKQLRADTVVLGFSAGLDSVYQAIRLIEDGYRVICFHLKNANSYENGQAAKQCLPIIAKLNKCSLLDDSVQYVEATIKKDFRKNNLWRQYWPENPIKNQLILSMMMDYAYSYNSNSDSNSHGIKYISLGDDFALSINDAVTGINTTDAREVTQAFLDDVKLVYPDIKFLPIDDKSDKLQRIKKLDEYGLRDDYYSCVQAGRFNRSYHDRCEAKYGITLPQHSCGCYCRKCAMHCLLEHYSGYITYPKDFIEKCWERMWKNSHSADYELFKPELSLEKRIYNLYNY